jgi:hypothetical protein
VPLGRGLSLQHGLFNLVREDREVTVEAVKQVALGLVRCEVADQSAFGRVFPELFDVFQIVL